MKHRLLTVSALLVLITASCQSVPLHIATAPVAANEEVVGPATGAATGIMLFQLIPIGQNQRFTEAYQRALTASGGTRLVDVVVEERWFWAWVLNGYRFQVTGTAVRAKK